MEEIHPGYARAPRLAPSIVVWGRRVEKVERCLLFLTMFIVFGSMPISREVGWVFRSLAKFDVTWARVWLAES